MARTTSKNRKSESQEIFEQADNAGRFAGSDSDAQSAHSQAVENIRKNLQSSREERNENENNDAQARRDPAETRD
jgi:hypothetical protein